MIIPTCPHCGLQVIPNKNMCPACRNDVTDLRNAAANLQRERLRTTVSDLISAGKSRTVIQAFLEEEFGLTAEQAAQEMTSASAHYDEAAEVRGPGDLLVGAAFFVSGAAVTVLTLSTALLQGGYAVIAYGPVVGGAYRLWIGASRFLHSRRAIRLRRE